VNIQSALPELAVEALDTCILGCLARLDEIQLNTCLLWQEDHRLAGQFWAFIAGNHPRKEPMFRWMICSCTRCLPGI